MVICLTEVRKMIFLKVDPETLVKYLEQILLKYNVRIKEFSKYYIRGEHGSYSATTPSDCKKEIRIGFIKQKDGTRLELIVDYTNDLVVTIISFIVTLIIGLTLYGATVDALGYLEQYKQGNIFTIMFEKPPYLLELIMNFTDDINAAEFFMRILYLVSILIMLAAVADLGFAIYLPFAVNKFTENIVADLYRIVQSIQITSKTKEKVTKEATKSDEKSKKIEKPPKLEQQISNIYCVRSSDSIHMICNIVGKNIDKNSLAKALIALGFNLYEVYEGVYYGEKRGSKLAQGFLDKELKVRVTFDKNKVRIVFETSDWTPFSNNDCREAEKILLTLL